MKSKKSFETHWYPKNPPKSVNSRTMAMLDFEILKKLTSSKTVSTKGQSFRGFTDILAEVRFFYFLRDNKHFAFIQRDLTNIVGRHGQLRRDQINKAKRNADFTLIIKGETSSVLSESLKKLKGTGYNRNFLNDWENCTTSNITDHINRVEKLAVEEITGNPVQFGIYNQQNPSDILLAKIKISEQSFEEISRRTGVPITMIYRHTQNKAPIDRQYAIMYAKYFGMDPSEILFNDISVPLEGTVNFRGDSPGEVKRKIGTYEFVKCPRDVYRPDIKCVRVEDSSIYNGCNLFYYQSKNSENITDNALYIFLFGEGRKKNKVIGRYNMFGKASVKNPDPEIYDTIFTNILKKSMDRHEEIDVSKLVNDNQNLFCSYGGKYLSDLTSNKPVAFYPIVAIINSELCAKDDHRSALIKEEEDWYKRRTLEDGGDLTDIVNFKDLEKKEIAELKEKILKSLEDATLTSKEQTFTVKKEMAGELDKAFEQSITKLQNKLEKISENVQSLGYPDFKLPDPRKELRKLEEDQMARTGGFGENSKLKKEPKVDWLVDPTSDLPVNLDEFIKKDPKKAAEFFNNEDFKKSEDSLTKMTVGMASGKDRAKAAAEIIINKNNENKDLKKSSEVLIVVTGGRDVLLREIDQILNILRKEMNPESDIIFGAILDENMEDNIRVSVMSVAQGKLKDEILINNAVSNYYFYKSIGARKDSLRLALGSPALKDNHRDEVLRIISEKTPEVSRYPKAEIYPLRKVS